MSQAGRIAMQLVLITIGVGLLIGGIASGSAERAVGTESSTGLRLTLNCPSDGEGGLNCGAPYAEIESIDGYIEGSNATNVSLAGIGAILIAICLGVPGRREPRER